MLCIGIDVGTSNCCVYAMRASSKPELVPSQSGNALTPSVVFVGNKGMLVGEVAQQSNDPLHTFYEFKRVIGRVYAQKELWHDAKHWPFSLGRPAHPDTDPPIYHAYYQDNLQAFTALQLTGALLQQLFTDIKTHYPQEPIGPVVVTVPAHFDHVQRQATLEAVKQHARDVELCNEPTAAAVAYVSTHPNLLQPKDNLLVFDLGAGTLDVTVLTYADNTYHVVVSDGIGNLGGLNFTQALLQRFIQHIKDVNQQDIRQDKALLALCRDLCEKAKRSLTLCEETTVLLPNSPGTPPYVCTRAQFEQIITPDLKRCRELLIKLVQGLTIKHIVLVGGSSRVPAVQQVIQQVLPDSQLHRDIHMDQCVALGACYLAGTASTQVQERLSHSIGLKTAKNVMRTLLQRNATLPCEATQILYPEKCQQKSVEICLYQGEDPVADQNVLLGRLRLNEVPPNQPELRLHVTIDAAGVIGVEIKDPTGRTARSTMKYNGIQ
jgi:molecular chaperone DnaK (HSP70)